MFSETQVSAVSKSLWSSKGTWNLRKNMTWMEWEHHWEFLSLSVSVWVEVPAERQSRGIIMNKCRSQEVAEKFGGEAGTRWGKERRSFWGTICWLIEKIQEVKVKSHVVWVILCSGIKNLYFINNQNCIRNSWFNLINFFFYWKQCTESWTLTNCSGQIG